jgi:DNA-binding CsgD family transcriptional regulator
MLCMSLLRLLRKGKTPEEISEFCDYDLKFVKKVQESMMQTV